MSEQKEEPKYTQKSTILLPDGGKSIETRSENGNRINQVFQRAKAGMSHLKIAPTSLLERGMKSPDHEPGEDGPQI